MDSRILHPVVYGNVTYSCVYVYSTSLSHDRVRQHVLPPHVDQRRRLRLVARRREQVAQPQHRHRLRARRCRKEVVRSLRPPRRAQQQRADLASVGPHALPHARAQALASALAGREKARMQAGAAAQQGARALERELLNVVEWRPVARELQPLEQLSVAAGLRDLFRCAVVARLA